MKIPLNFYDVKGQEMITIGCRILLPHVSGSIEFCIDTGSPCSFIGATDAERLSIGTRSSSKDPTYYWGDKALRMHSTHAVSFWFRAEDNGREKIKIINVKRMLVTKDFIHNKESKESPSLLGLDFLIANKLNLRVNCNKKEAWLEI